MITDLTKLLKSQMIWLAPFHLQQYSHQGKYIQRGQTPQHARVESVKVDISLHDFNDAQKRSSTVFLYNSFDTWCLPLSPWHVPLTKCFVE